MTRMGIGIAVVLVIVSGFAASAQSPAKDPAPKETPKVEAASPALTIEQKLTLKDKLRDATEAQRLASADVLAKEIAEFMVARTRNAQEKGAAVTAYYQSLPQVAGYLLNQDGEYVKQKDAGPVESERLPRMR